MSLTGFLEAREATSPRDLEDAATGFRVLGFLFELHGSFIPGSALGSLTSLGFVDLHQNNISGSIPSEVGYVSNLTYLDLSHNDLQGGIPLEIGTLEKLTFCEPRRQLPA